MKVKRFMHEHGVRQEALRAISLASYHHAQNNPRAVMHGRPLDEARLRRLALDRRAVPPLRLLPGERRRRRASSGHAGRARQGLPADARLPARRRCPARGTAPAAPVAQHAGVGTRPASRPWRRACTTWPASSRRTWTSAVLRELHRRRADEPRRARLLHARRGRTTFLHRRRTCSRPDGELPAQHQRRQPGRVLHARPGAEHRGGAPDLRGSSSNQVPGADVALVVAGPMVTPASAR